MLTDHRQIHGRLQMRGHMQRNAAETGRSLRSDIDPSAVSH